MHHFRSIDETFRRNYFWSKLDFQKGFRGRVNQAAGKLSKLNKQIEKSMKEDQNKHEQRLLTRGDLKKISRRSGK